MIYLATKVKSMEVVLATLAASVPGVDSQNLRASIAAESIIIGVYVEVRRCGISMWSKQHVHISSITLHPNICTSLHESAFVLGAPKDDTVFKV